MMLSGWILLITNWLNNQESLRLVNLKKKGFETYKFKI